MTRPNILLIVLDATRTDACSCYGDTDRLTTPHLDALAAEGTLYEQAITPAPWTFPSFSSLFTGFFPNQLGVYEQRRLPVSPATLASLFSQHGYATLGITSNSWMGADFGLQRGFDHFYKLWQILQTSQDVNELALLSKTPERSRVAGLLAHWTHGSPVKNVLNAAYNRLWAYRYDYGASRTLGPFLRWLKDQQAPWFALVHYLEAHLEYKPPRSWARRFARDWTQAKELLAQDQWRLAWRHIAGVERLSTRSLAAWRDLYLAEVAYMDSHLGRLIEALRERGVLDQTVVAITADHGESLGEHGLLNHQYGLYDTLIRVPLVLRYPPLFDPGQRVPWQVQSHDLFATLLEAAEIEAPPTSSRSLLRGEDEARPFTVAEYGIPKVPPASQLRRFGLRREDLEPFARGFTALRAEPYKLILGTDGSTELYNWREDPAEEHDLASHQPHVVGDLRARLRRWQEEQGAVSAEAGEGEWEVDPTTAARLRALGYIE